MNSSLARGKQEEQAVCRWLTEKGYEILCSNWHSRYGEIDVIATQDDYICFIEVKARRNGSMVSPLESVSAAKQRKIIKTAMVYLQQHPCQLQPRFDVFAITTNQNGEWLDYDYVMGAFQCEPSD